MTDTDILRDLDFTDIACQCGHYECREGCPRRATIRVSFHALDHCDGTKDDNAELDADGNYTLLVCLHCLRMLELAADTHLRKLKHYGCRPQCGTCGAPVESTRPDIIREVTAL